MLHNHIIYTPFSDWRFNLTKAKDSYLWDDQGKQYIDFTSGWNVANLGWNDEEVVNAGIEQMQKNTYVPMWATSDIQEQYATNLTKSLGHRLEWIGRANGGAEAIEMAIKTVRVFTGKKKIVSFYEQFHGSTTNALSLSYREAWMSKLTDPRTDIVHLEYPNIYRTDKSPEEVLATTKSELEAILAQEDVAAVITEGGIVTGWGSVYIAPDRFTSMVRELTKKYQALMILDEVGTGFGRTGVMWGMDRENISPDVVTLAKGISNGSAPLAAMITTKEIAEATFAGSNLQSTFGWNPVACAIANKVLDIHQKLKTWELAKQKGEFLRKKLTEALVDHPNVGEIRGWGMENGIDLVTDKKSKVGDGELGKKVTQAAFDAGLHTVTDGSGVIHVMPPLTIDQDVLDKGLDILIKSIKETTK